jgi:hypothetical protein
MTFGAMAALMIFLHMAPNIAGASWSVYKHHDITTDHPHPKVPKYRR